MTNYEKIKAMNLEELVLHIMTNTTCSMCVCLEKESINCNREYTCNKGIEKWLEQEAEK